MLAKKKTYSVDDRMESESPDPNADAPEQADPADESDTGDTKADEMAEGESPDDAEQGDTAYLSSEALGGRKVKAGETLSVKVVSVDEDGNAVIKCDHGNKMGGIAEAASAFDKEY